MTDIEELDTRKAKDWITAPWSDEQVENINRFQNAGAFHPFTCNCPHPERNYKLKATNEGLRCTDCGWDQRWVHVFMADGSAMANWEESMSRLGLWPF
jgi:hypothetical protein